MKNTFLFSLLAVLSLAGCNRHDKSVSAASNADAVKPANGEPAAFAQQDASDSAKISPASSTTAGAVSDQRASDLSLPGAALPATATVAVGAPAAPTGLSAPVADTAAAATADVPFAATATIPDPTASDGQKPISDRFAEWKLLPDDIRNEVQASGTVVRTRTLGADEPTGAMDSVLARSIATKLQAHSSLSGIKFDVQADRETVTLNGSASSLEQIGTATGLALDTPGVSKVVAQIKLEAAP